MDDLITWLLEQIAEDERVARDVSGKDDVWHGEHLDLWVVDDDHSHDRIGTTRRRVLAECEAKRRGLDEVRAEQDRACDTCAYIYDFTPILRAMALPYADRPGYQESWRPA